MTHIERIYSLSESSDPRGCVCNYCRQTMSGELDERMHMDDHMKILRMISGEMEWAVNRDRYEVKTGELVITNNTELRQIERMNTPGLLLDWVQFTPATVYPNVNLSAHFQSVEFARICSIFYRRPPGFSHVIRADSPYFENIGFYMDRVASCASGGDILRDEAIVTNLRALVIEITRHYAKLLTPDAFLYDSGIERDTEVLTEAISFVREHYTENISEAMVAQKLFVSVSTLSRIFNGCTGISFRAYLRQLRLDKTLALINSDPLVTALDAALSCGFNSASGFYKAPGDVCGKGGVRSLRQGKDRN